MNKHIKKSILFLGAIFIFSNSFGDENQSVFQQGNQFYQNDQYTEALTLYQFILDNGHESGDLYFNMGNCYYKLQQISKAILFFEKAKRLIPGDSDVKANLALANQAILDKIEPLPKFFLFKFIDNIVHLIPRGSLQWIVAVLYIILMISLILWIVARSQSIRKMTFRSGIVLGILLVLFGSFLYGQWRAVRFRNEAVIMETKVDVMGSPSESGVGVFTLHEGTKVRIDQASGEWVEIVLLDGKVGWVKQEVLEKI